MDIADEFIALIEQVVGEEKHRTGKVRKAIRSLAVKCGVPLDPYFRQWLEENFGGEEPRHKQPEE